MDLFRRYGNLLKADGTNQQQRTLPALEQGYVLPDERSLADLVDYARRLAEEIRFYSLTGQATGDWRAFLEPLLDPATGRARAAAELEREIAGRRDWPPHVALFLVFLKLFRHLQDDLNELPERHLRHYYERELRLRRRAAAADDVHVIFELARNAAPTLLPAGTLLDAGKDGEGRALTYATRSELVVSAARVREVRRLVVERDRRGHRFFAADAVSPDEGPSWHTFGRRQLDLDASRRFMAEAAVGFAVAAPLLRLAEGERSLRFTAALRAANGVYPPSQGIGFGLVVELTGEEGWVAPASFDARLVERPSDPEVAAGAPDAPLYLEIDLTLPAAAPAIVPFDAALHGAGPASEWPVLRCLLRGEAGGYETLDGLVVEWSRLAVAVRGVRDLVVRNDQGALAPDQPMPLFGSQPLIGSHFYVGSAEVFSKKLTFLALHLEWKDPPEDLFEHYRGYFDFIDSDLGATFRNLFVADVELLHDRTWDHPLGKHALFGARPSDPRRIAVAASAFDSAFGPRPYEARPVPGELERFDPALRNGFVRLTLRGPTRDDLHSRLGVPYASEVPFQAFGHRAYGRRYAAEAIALGRWDGSDEEPVLPDEPYTPTLASLTLDYDSSVEILPTGRSEETLFTVGPWGHTAADPDAPARLVPEVEGAAALFLGVEGLVPPANLSLLFEIDSGTATGSPAGEALAPGETEWSYLAGAGWRALPRSAVLSDGTRGFQQAGLVVLSVGREASTEHTLLPAGQVWLRALIRRPPESAARTRAVSAQAARASFVPAAGGLSDYAAHLSAGLAAGTVRRPVRRDAAIKKVSQPQPSFGGRGPEGDPDYFRRSSERLRHRARAVTAWDFERLVLEAFPEVFKVKCLPHSDAGGKARAGEAAVVVVPDLRSVAGSNPLEPRAGAVLMRRIADFLAAGVTSPFAALHVVHPVYERLRVDARVAFQAGLDAGYYANVLDEDLRRFLSPWAFEEGQDVVFGARIYRSELLAFMEGRRYVDHVTDFALYHSFTGPARGGVGRMEIGRDFVVAPDPSPAIGAMAIGGDFVVGRGVEVAEASLPHAILVSHAEHRLTPVEAGSDLCSGVAALGIGAMTVAIDFEVRAP